MMLDTTEREIPASVANVYTAEHIDGRTLDGSSVNPRPRRRRSLPTTCAPAA